MKRLVCAVLALNLTGCGTLSALSGGPASPNNAEVLRALGEHMDKCDRHYQGSLGLGASFTFNIECKGRDTPQS